MILEISGIISFLLLGFGLGMLHAFDPDHVAAVGGMSAGRDARPVWLFSLHWSFGHGTALIAVALFVFIVGTAIPERLSAYAEKSVGFVLIIIGVMALYRIMRDYLFPHAEKHQQAALAAPVVGLLHGTAGSAPLLALVPLAQLSQPALGVFYVLFFSLGVLLAMTGFGLAIAYGLRRLSRVDALWLSLVQSLLALFSLLFGLYLVILSH